MNDITSKMFELMPLITMLQKGNISFADVLSGRGNGAMIRMQLLNLIQGKDAAKRDILEALTAIEESAKSQKKTFIDVLMGSSADPELGDKLKNGLKSL
jgi:hypothetical protein